MSILSEYRDKSNALRNIVKELREVLDAHDLDWEVRYDLIFGSHRKLVVPALESAGMRLEYYDPDTTYEEDSRAYVEALESLLSSSEPIVSEPESPETDDWAG